MKSYNLDNIIDACELENVLKAGNNITITKLDNCTLEISSSVKPFSELTYIGGYLTKIEVYDSISKITLLTTKDFNYTTGLLTKILETNAATSGTKTTNLTYDVNNVLINIEKI